MKVSIIVPAFNEELLLDKSLSQIKSAANVFGLRGWEVELIVCDNNSTDRTAEIARAAGAMVVFEPFNQIARARNRGAAAATGDWLIFVDADSHPSAELFKEVAEQITSGRCLAGGSTVRMDEKHLMAEFFTWLWNCSSRMGHWLAGSFIFVAVQPRIVCGGGTGVEPPFKATGAGDEQGNRCLVPLSAGDFRAQDAALHNVGASKIAGARHVQSACTQPSRVLCLVVRRAKVNEF